MKINLPSIFRRKVYAPIHSGEMVVTRQQMEAYKAREAINEVLEDIEAQGMEIDSDELEQRIEDVCKTYGISLPKRRVKPKEKPHICTQCGAPLKDGKCEYCGMDYN